MLVVINKFTLLIAKRQVEVYRVLCEHEISFMFNDFFTIREVRRRDTVRFSWGGSLL